ncbi:SpaA isopeptide-forming pilin-related protein [Parvimonas parva]|uniref:SpaA-like prealbumin fold domain-containing protein n=1 Tax=Parvimonas parva TaxID=2769485 RepID=A0ABS1CAG7_9FIRM|nr:SpaA isopeptide-forming pilin-related protein [Parvimonas parva]MBK1469025.1 hypothetical protein [Parvimonas parva]
MEKTNNLRTRIFSFLMLFSILLTSIGNNIFIKAKEESTEERKKVVVELKEVENGFLRFKGSDKKEKEFVLKEEITQIDVSAYADKGYYFAGYKLLDENDIEIREDKNLFVKKFANHIEIFTKDSRYKKIKVAAKMISEKSEIANKSPYDEKSFDKEIKDKITTKAVHEITKDGFVITPKQKEYKGKMQPRVEEKDLPEGEMYLYGDLRVTHHSFSSPCQFSVSNIKGFPEFELKYHPTYGTGLRCNKPGWPTPANGQYKFKIYRYEPTNPYSPDYAQYWVEFEGYSSNRRDAFYEGSQHIKGDGPFVSQGCGGYIYVKKDTIIPPPDGYRIRIRKADEYNNTITSSYAKFKMWYEDEEYLWGGGEPSDSRAESGQNAWMYTTTNGYTKFDTWNKAPGTKIKYKEVKAPVGYIKSSSTYSDTIEGGGKTSTLTVKNKKDEPPTPPRPEKKIYRFYNLKIVKKDSDSYKPLKGAEFEIREKNTGKLIETVTTGSDGSAKTKDLDSYLPCIIKEKKAPEGYEKNETSYTINKSDFSYSYEKDYEDMTFKYYKYEKTIYNKKQKTKLKLAKVGEVLKEYKDEKVTIRNKSYNVKTPIFKKSFIAGAKFDIKQNGKVIKTVTSKTDFIEVDLPLGKYQVVEKEAPTGFVKTSKVYDVDLTGSSEVISKSLEIENEREKVKFNLTKSFEKGMFKNETYAVFGLFTKEKENTLEKDTLIEVLEFDKENSTKEFKNTIKGKYYVKELDNSSGYRKDEKNHDVDLSKEKVATKTIINKLKRGGIKIVKLDAKNKEIKLKDVKFRLLANNKERKEIGVYTTNENGEINIENLELGEYILEEIQTKDGYILDETQRIIRVKEDNKITMETVENDFTKVEISKTDITGEKELPGAKLKVVDSEGKTVEEWETDGKPHRINKMKVGKYKLIEEIAPDGYVIANEVEFEVKATGEVQKVVMKDDTTKVKVQKVGKDDESKQLEGAEFVIEEVEETEETTDKKETESKDLSFLDEKRKFLVKKENLIEEDLEKLL